MAKNNVIFWENISDEHWQKMLEDCGILRNRDRIVFGTDDLGLDLNGKFRRYKKEDLYNLLENSRL